MEFSGRAELSMQKTPWGKLSAEVGNIGKGVRTHLPLGPKCWTLTAVALKRGRAGKIHHHQKKFNCDIWSKSCLGVRARQRVMEQFLPSSVQCAGLSIMGNRALLDLLIGHRLP